MSEPFPLLSTPADQLHALSVENSTSRRRRISAGPADDVGISSGLATSLAHMNAKDGITPKTNGSASAASQASRLSKRRKARSLLRRAKSFAFRYTWVVPVFILSIFGFLYALNPTESNPVHHFIFLSYRLPIPAGSPPGTQAEYDKGMWDLAFVSFYVVVLSFTREFVMQEMLRPLAKFFGLRSKAKQARFMEQMYTAVYFAFLGPAGLYVMSGSPVWFFNTRGMYEDFPHKTLVAEFKFYYLFQAAYWAQQAIVLVLGMEKPRKDFKELVGHHIVSLALIGLSYRFHFTYIGLPVYITHDISDFFLATSKSLNYIDSAITAPYFALFMGVWIYTRHYLNLRIIASLFTEFKTVGPYEVDWANGQYKCTLSFVITFSLLASLQALNLFWLFFIVRIAYRMVVHNMIEDDRSDAEGESDVEIKTAGDLATPPAQNGAAKAKANTAAAKTALAAR